MLGNLMPRKVQKRDYLLFQNYIDFYDKFFLSQKSIVKSLIGLIPENIKMSIYSFRSIYILFEKRTPNINESRIIPSPFYTVSQINVFGP